jgi:hypothetical protein
MKNDTLRSDRLPLAWARSDRPNFTRGRRGGNRMRRLLARLAATIAAGILIAVLVNGGAAAPSARAASVTNGLFAYVVATNTGPLPACDGTNCTEANIVWDFIHVVNVNPLMNHIGFTDRTTWPNSFVINGVGQETFVNGVDEGTITATPPPNANPLSWSGHWHSTVDCEGQPGSFHTPCDVLVSPAVLPGENVSATYFGFQHGVGEPNGTYVFKYTIHRTLNGNPVDLTAFAPPIQMTN